MRNFLLGLLIVAATGCVYAPRIHSFKKQVLTTEFHGEGAAFGDINTAADAIRRKLNNDSNSMLAPFRALRCEDDD